MPNLNLTTLLGLLALVVIGVLYVQPRLQAWQRRRRLQAVAAAAAERAEPTLDPALPDHEGAPAPEAMAAVPDAVVDPLAPPRPRRVSPRLDALIDAIVPLLLDHPVSGEAVMAHLPPSRRAGSKPFYLEGLDAESGTWEALAAGRRYAELQAGLQMVNRLGPINEIEYSEFLQKLVPLAEALGAQVDTSAEDMHEVVERARTLHQETDPLDAQLTVTLQANEVPWSVAFVQQMAARLGFVAGALPGRLVLPSDEEGAPPVLVLGFDPQAALAEDSGRQTVLHCTLSLDVPQTPADKEPFPAWHQAARRLAADLDATVVDDGGHPISLQAFADIARELEGLYQRLETLDLPAGSAAARRVFS